MKKPPLPTAAELQKVRNWDHYRKMVLANEDLEFLYDHYESQRNIAIHEGQPVCPEGIFTKKALCGLVIKLANEAS